MKLFVTGLLTFIVVASCIVAEILDPVLIFYAAIPAVLFLILFFLFRLVGDKKKNQEQELFYRVINGINVEIVDDNGLPISDNPDKRKRGNK